MEADKHPKINLEQSEQEVKDYYRSLKSSYSKRYSQFYREIAQCAPYPPRGKGLDNRIDYSVFRNESENHLRVLLGDAYSNKGKLEAIADFECNEQLGILRRTHQAAGIAAELILERMFGYTPTHLNLEGEIEDLDSRVIFDEMRNIDALHGTTDHVFDFIARIGRMIDNLYHMVADYCGIKITNPRNFQTHVTRAISSINPELASYLTQRIQGSETIAEFYRIRNNVMHDAPAFIVRGTGDINHPIGYYQYVLITQKEGEENGREILPYLYGLYDHILQTVTGTVQLMLEVTPQK